MEITRTIVTVLIPFRGDFINHTKPKEKRVIIKGVTGNQNWGSLPMVRVQNNRLERMAVQEITSAFLLCW